MFGSLRIIETSQRWPRRLYDFMSSRQGLHATRTSLIRIAVCQMCAVDNVSENFDSVKEMVRGSADMGAQMVFFPECFSFIGSKRLRSNQISESLSGPTVAKYKLLASECHVWLSLGGFHETVDSVRSADGGPMVSNTHLVIDTSGNIVSSYRKAHLFDAPFVGLMESSFTVPGNQLQVIDCPVGKLGLSICYDVRFPEMYASLREMGAQVLAIPAAFTVPTGKAHWEILLRARAIETQCYVIAAAQCGRHNEDRMSYGHSMVVDPWGEVIARCEDEEGIITADIDIDKVEEVRKKMPVWDHRRPNLYVKTPSSL